MIHGQGSSFVGEAAVFVSHAWKYNFLHVVSTLQAHFAQTLDILIWFNWFRNNQHLAVSLKFDWWMGTFMTAIAILNRLFSKISCLLNFRTSYYKSSQSCKPSF
jgi:hypothetical protein